MTKREFVAQQMRAAREEALLTWKGMHEGNLGEKNQIDWAAVPVIDFNQMVRELSFLCSALLNNKTVRVTIERNPDEKHVIFKTYTGE